TSRTTRSSTRELRLRNIRSPRKFSDARLISILTLIHWSACRLGGCEPNSRSTTRQREQTIRSWLSFARAPIPWFSTAQRVRRDPFCPMTANLNRVLRRLQAACHLGRLLREPLWFLPRLQLHGS